MTVSASVEVKNKLGIHARPAMVLFELVQGFDAHVLVEADADSVIGLLMLDYAQGKAVGVQVEALAAVVELLTSGFNEEYWRRSGRYSCQRLEIGKIATSQQTPAGFFIHQRQKKIV